MRHVLIVSYYFPPIGGIGSIRMARFAECLPEFGWEPAIIAPSDTPHALDPYLSFPHEKVVRSRSIELARLGGAGRVASSATPVVGPGDGRPGLHALVRSAAHRYVYYPDAQIGWYPGAVRAGLRLLRQRRFDAIFSSSNPITAHLVARTLARRARVPWVAEFRDPWADRMPTDHAHRRRAARLQRSLVTAANAVVVPTPTMATYLSAEWGRDIALIPNGHDVERPVSARPAQPTLTYVGTFYPGRQDLSGVLTAIRQLEASAPANAPRLRFVGAMPPELRAEVAVAGLEERVEVTGFLPLEQAMAAMADSSMLLACGFAGTDPLSLGVIPAKVFEYLASGLPILYVGNPADDAARLLAEQPGCHIAQPGDVEAILAALRTGLEGPLETRDTEQFSRRERTRQLADVFDAASAVSRP
jgi:glycosyltransferase involved in cell wall biosynthesis